MSVCREIDRQYVWRYEESMCVQREKKRWRVYLGQERGGSVQRDRLCVDTEREIEIEREIARGCVKR